MDSKCTKPAVRYIREVLAATQHEIWSHWMRYLFDQGAVRGKDGAHIIYPRNVERWKRQMNTPYEELSEQEKVSDRHQADKVLCAIDAHEKAVTFNQYAQYAEIDDTAELAEAKREYEVISEIDRDEYDAKKFNIICDYERRLYDLQRQFAQDMEELDIWHTAYIADAKDVDSGHIEGHNDGLPEKIAIPIGRSTSAARRLLIAISRWRPRRNQE